MSLSPISLSGGLLPMMSNPPAASSEVVRYLPEGRDATAQTGQTGLKPGIYLERPREEAPGYTVDGKPINDSNKSPFLNVIT